MKLDESKIKFAKKADILPVIEKRLGQGRKKASEILFKCPFHDEKNPSLSVNESKNLAKCFGCGWGGDAIHFLTSMGSTFQEAVLEINGDSIFSNGEAVVNNSKKVNILTWKQVKPTSLPESFNHYKWGAPSMPPFVYRDSDGSVLGYIIRYFNKEENRKEISPLVFATDGNRSEWRSQGFDKPRPLYNLDKIAKYPDRTVLIVEGEKAADAAEKLLDSFDKVVVTTWMGGTNAVGYTDWSPLFGRKVIKFPDNDISQKYGKAHKFAGHVKPFHEQPGNKAMLEIGEILQPHCPINKWVNAPEGSPDKWDCADWVTTPHEARNYILKNAIDTPFPPKEEEVKKPEPVEKKPEEPKKKNTEDGRFDTDYFKFLGYSAESGDHAYFFFRKSTCKIISMSPSAMTTPNLIQLAPLKWWEDKFPSGKSGMAVNGVIEYLIRTSELKGSFNPENIRGRGAWVEKDTIIIHSGSHLLVNGTKTPLGTIGGKYMYERAEAISIGEAEPLSNKDAAKLIEVISNLNWERPINAYLMAGWCVVATICGALKWRPHIWITGPTGSGKSWVVEKIVEVLIGEVGKKMQGSGTSEPGIRQSLGKDARPIIFDEAEGENKISQDKIQEVLGLMRLASSESGGNIVKGSSSGRATNYIMRSCFLFSSVAVQLMQRSDKTRVSVLGLKEDRSDNWREKWANTLKMYNDTINDEFASKLQARTIQLIPVILKNANTFSNAAATELGSQRAGDQIGTLLAGAFSLTSSKEISFDDAIGWIRQKDWSEEKSLDGTRDELMLFGHLMRQITSVETGEHGKVERTVAELLLMAGELANDGLISPEGANNRLKRLGIKYHDDGTSQMIMISNTNAWIDKCLSTTPWAKGYSKILQRLEGAWVSEKTRFGATSSRAVVLPLSLLG